MPYCSSCGKSLRPGSLNFCIDCGKPISGPTSNAVQKEIRLRLPKKTALVLVGLLSALILGNFIQEQQAEVARKAAAEKAGKAAAGALQKALQEERAQFEAERQKMPETYQKAVAMAKADNYSEAITLFEQLTKLDANYKDVASRLKTARDKLAANKASENDALLLPAPELSHLKVWPRVMRLTSAGTGPLVMVASGDSCFQDVIKAGDLAGTEQRKRLIEMAEVGCLYGVDPGTLVQAEPHNIEGYHAFAIVILNGALRGRKGIVSVAFVEEK
jgi:hypothetical protein